MGTIRRVPEVYPTLSAAHDAAADGDTIQVAPNTVAGGATITKRVAIVGDTQTPWIDGPLLAAASWPPVAGATPGVLRLRSECLVEACRIGASGTNRYQSFYVQPPPAGALALLNRCLFHVVSFPGPKGEDGPANVRMENCSSSGSVNFGGYAAGQLGEVLAMRATGITAGSDPYVAVADIATVDTPGYGPEYGDWYAPQWQGVPYRLAGSEILEATDSPADSQILLYRETAYQSGRVERVAWLETAPDPITGEWEFRYLPTLDSAGNPQRYAVAINPPECYGGELLRWYPPQQGES
jgi:hypothetical protein